MEAPSRQRPSHGMAVRGRWPRCGGGALSSLDRLVVAAAAALAVGSLAVARAARPGQRSQKQQRRQSSPSSARPGGAGGADAPQERWVNESEAGVASSLLGLDGLRTANGSRAPGHGGHLVSPRRDRTSQARQEAHRRRRNDLALFGPERLAGNMLGHARPEDDGHILHLFSGFLDIGSDSHKVGHVIHTGEDDQELVDAVINAVLQERRAYNDFLEAGGALRFWEARAERVFQMLKVPQGEDHMLRKAVSDFEKAELSCLEHGHCDSAAFTEALNEVETFVSNKTQLEELVEAGVNKAKGAKDFFTCLHQLGHEVMGTQAKSFCASQQELEAKTDTRCSAASRRTAAPVLCASEIVSKFEGSALQTTLEQYGKESMRTELKNLLAEPRVQDVEKQMGNNTMLGLFLDNVLRTLMIGEKHWARHFPDYVDVILEEGREVLGREDRLVQVVGIFLNTSDATKTQPACADFCKGKLKLNPANFAHRDLVIADHGSNLFSHYWNQSLMTCKQFHDILLVHPDRVCKESLEQRVPKHNAAVLLKMWPQIEDNCCEDEPRAYYHVLGAYKRSLEDIVKQLVAHMLEMTTPNVKHLIHRLDTLLKDVMANLHVKLDDILLTGEEKHILGDIVRETADRMQEMHIKLKEAMKKEEFLTKTEQALKLLKELLGDVHKALARFKEEVLKASETSWEEYKKKANAQHSGEVVTASAGGAAVNSEGGTGGSGGAGAGRYGKEGKITEIKVALQKWKKKTSEELEKQDQIECETIASNVTMNPEARELCNGNESLRANTAEIEQSMSRYLSNYSEYASQCYEYFSLEHYIERLYDRLASADSGNEEPAGKKEDGGDEAAKKEDGGDEAAKKEDGGDEAAKKEDGGDEAAKEEDGGDEAAKKAEE